MIKVPGDSQVARAQGIGTESPQGRFFAPRGLGEERYCLKKQVMLIIFITFANRERELRAIFRIDVHLV